MSSRMLDPVLGQLTHDPELDWWTGEVELDGEPVGLLLWSQEDGVRLDTDTLAFLRGFYKDIRRHVPDIGATAAAVTVARLPNWTPPAQAPDVTTLRRELTLERLELSTEGQAALFFWAGDLLPRPFVVALTDSEGQVRAVDLKG